MTDVSTLDSVVARGGELAAVFLEVQYQFKNARWESADATSTDHTKERKSADGRGPLDQS